MRLLWKEKLFCLWFILSSAWTARCRGAKPTGGGPDDANGAPCAPPCVPGSDSLMAPKEHGTSRTPVQFDLRWGCDWATADRICNFNRHYAEPAGSWATGTTFLRDEAPRGGPVTFYDSNTGRPLFEAPRGRTWRDFLQESTAHGWPSFRDAEVNWEFVRVLRSGETVSVDGTHLGHNLPDAQGNRFCINLVSIAGHPAQSETSN